jgi:hypothetical protein
MKRSEYPWLHGVADAESATAQRAHFVALSLQLAIFIGVSVLAQLQNLAIGIIATLVNRERKYDKRWFDARAVAESAKTVAWRYVMHVAPFDSENADAKLVQELTSIGKDRPVLLTHSHGGHGEQITDAMKALRNAGFVNRKSAYLRDRVEDQRAWYAEKATKNSRYASLWFWMTLCLQIAALVSVVMKAGGVASFSPASLFMTLAATATAWNQAQRHDELSASYSLAAHEIANLKTLLGGCDEETSCLLLVEDVEEAISREHTMWRARRNVSRSR